MSKMLYLVEYILEDGVPIDETSKNLDSATVPEEFNRFLEEHGFVQTIRIMETATCPPSIDIEIIQENDEERLEQSVRFVEDRTLDIIRRDKQAIAGELLVPTETEATLDELYVWLHIRSLLKSEALLSRGSRVAKIVIG